MKRLFNLSFLTVLMAVMTGLMTAAAPTPTTTFTLLQGLPETMNVGETYTVVVKVDSDVPFINAHALPSFQFPGKGVVAVQGGDLVGSSTSAMLQITYLAKGSTSKMPEGFAPVFFVVGVRYGAGYVAVERYEFHVTVP